MRRLLLSFAISAVLFTQGNLLAAVANDPNFLKTISEQVAKRSEGGIFNLSFKSAIDGQVQPLLMKIPKGYDSAQKWPLLVVLHGRGDGPIIVPAIDSMVQIGPYGRGDLFYRGLGEQDVFETFEMAKKIFNIDENRIYLTGFSMGAMGTFELGLKYPYMWAACVPVCGKLQNPLLIENGGNLPFWIHAGTEDVVVPPSYSNIVYELGKEKDFTNWKYTEHKKMGHSFRVNWPQIEQWLLEQSRQKPINQIIYSGRVPEKIYWFQVQKLIDPEKIFRVEASIENQEIHLRTENIESYKIHVKECPISEEMELVVFENGSQINFEEDVDIFIR